MYQFSFAFAADGEQLALTVQAGFQKLSQPSSEKLKTISVTSENAPGVLADCSNLVLVLSPLIWVCGTAVEALRLAQATSMNVVVVYIPTLPPPHVPLYPTASSPQIHDQLLSCSVALEGLILSAPADLKGLFDVVEAVPYRLHPFGERACLRVLVELGGCGSYLAAPNKPIDEVGQRWGTKQSLGLFNPYSRHLAY